MFDDLSAYFYENVITSFEEYVAVKNSGKAGRSRDLRAAMNVAISLYHLREQLPPDHIVGRHVSAAQCPDYELLGDVVNAAKHRLLTRRNPQIINSAQIEEEVVITEYQDEKGQYNSVEKIVVVRLLDGSERDMFEVIINVMNYWAFYLQSIGVIDKELHFRLPTDIQPKTRVQCSEGRLGIEMLQGVRFKLKQRLRRFNYSTMKIEPVDLTGAKVTFKVFKPCLEINIAIKNEKTGEQLSRTITLNDIESERLRLLLSEDEAQSYILSLEKAKDAFRELNIEAGRLKEIQQKKLV